MLEIRAIADQSELCSVYRLTHDEYVRAGYIAPHPDGCLRHYPHLDHIPQTTVLVALQDSQIVGTNSWTIDSKHGLHVDEDFLPEADAVRAEGRKLGASWRIVTRHDVHNHNAILLGLIKTTVIAMIGAGIQTALFTFAPRHERAYQRILNMRTIGYRDSVNHISTPAVLMRLDAEDVPRKFLT